MAIGRSHCGRVRRRGEPRSRAPSATRPGATSTSSSATSAPTASTAAEVAEQFDLHPNVARHHLEKLTGGGYLDRRARQAPVDGPARAGRPSKRYRAGPLDADARRSRPSTTTCSARLLARALDALGPTQAEALADEVGFEYGTHARGAHGAHRGSPLGEGRARVGRRRAHRARLRGARRGARRSAHDRVRALPVRRGRAAVPARACARSTAAWSAACSPASTARRSRSSRRAAPTAAITASPASDGESLMAPARARTSTTRRPRRCDRSRSTRCSRTCATHFADPGRLHAEGHATRVAVETAREQVAALFGARPREVVFTVDRHRGGEHRGVRARWRAGGAGARGHHRGRALVRCSTRWRAARPR